MYGRSRQCLAIGGYVKAEVPLLICLQLLIKIALPRNFSMFVCVQAIGPGARS